MGLIDDESRFASDGADGLGALAVEERDRVRRALGIEEEESEEQDEEREE